MNTAAKNRSRLISPPFTPGPWMVEPINGGQTYQITSAEDRHIAVIAETPVDGTGRDEANAKAIAALPDLYGALIEAKREMWDMARASWTRDDFKNWAVIQQIDAALTNADGKAR
jgi:hypothetical protein